jgi:hypothetical protein
LYSSFSSSPAPLLFVPSTTSNEQSLITQTQ